jgi:hypothetical protein
MPDEPIYHSTSGDSAAPPSTEQVKADLRRAGDELGAAASELRGTAEDEASRLKDAATTQIGAATDRARAFADARKSDAADRLDDLSNAVSRVAGELRDQDSGSTLGGIASDLAGGINKLSNTVRTSSVDDLIGMTQDFGRRQPLALLGVAALAGFAAGRFVVASGQRQSPAYRSDNDEMGDGDGSVPGRWQEY